MCSLKHQRFSPRSYCYDLRRIISFVLVQPQWAHRCLQDADIAFGPWISHHHATQLGNVLGLGQSSIYWRKHIIIHYLVVPEGTVVNWLFPKNMVFREWDLFCLSNNILSPAPSSHLFLLAAGIYKTKLGPNEKNLHQAVPSNAKHIFRSTFSPDTWSKHITIHRALCQLLKLRSVQVSVPSLKSRTQHNACMDLSGKQDPYQFLCTPFLQPLRIHWCVMFACEKHLWVSACINLARPCQQTTFCERTRCFPTSGHYQLWLKYNFAVCKTLYTTIQVDLETRRARNCHPNTLQQILKNAYKSQLAKRIQKVASSKHVQTNDVNSHASSPTWILPFARFLRHISR